MDQNLNQLTLSKHCWHTNISIIIVKLKCGMQCCRELLVAALCECFMRDRPLNDDRTIFGSFRERIGREIVSCYFSFLATITVGLGGMYHDALLAMLSSILPSALDTLECGKTCIGHITWSVGIVCFFTTTSNHDFFMERFSYDHIWSQLHRDGAGQQF